jgi:predicted nuclease with TOPRIM domain
VSRPYLAQQDIAELYKQLVEVNSKLWDVEDKLRVIETEKRFEGEFIDLARKVYYLNDERFEVKNKINNLTSSKIKEVKEYVNYKK